MILYHHTPEPPAPTKPNRATRRSQDRLQRHYERQRRVTDPDLAIRMGYSPARRAVIYLLGESMVKLNRGAYRQLYDQRKQYELTRTEGAAKSPKHAHNRAMRYTTKRLLRVLWGFARTMGAA